MDHHLRRHRNSSVSEIVDLSSSHCKSGDNHPRRRTIWPPRARHLHRIHHHRTSPTQGGTNLCLTPCSLPWQCEPGPAFLVPHNYATVHQHMRELCVIYESFGCGQYRSGSTGSSSVFATREVSIIFYLQWKLQVEANRNKNAQLVNE